MESDSEDSWEETKTPQESIDIFYKTVFEFAGVIRNLCLEEEKLHPKKYADGRIKPSTKIAVITGLLQLMNKENLTKHYVNYVLSWKSYIDNRDTKIFLENDDIYPGAPKADIEFFRDLWRPTSPFHLDKDEKETVFEYFDIMLHYCNDWKEKTGFVAKWEE